MMYAGRVILATAMVAVSVVGLPNHLKAVVVDTDPIPAKGVSVSFGGYSAKAGLGGSSSGGGLFASADSPHGSAGAGLGGSSSGGGLFASAASPHGSAGAGLGGSAAGEGGLGASASTGGSLGGSAGGHGKPSIGGHKPGHQQGAFDGIFNIPISVLQAVNTYLNNRGPVTKTFRRRGHHPEVIQKTVTPVQSSPQGSVSEASATSGSGATAESEVHTGAGAGAHGPVVVHKRVNYDDIFNIPISVLKSVNHMLNGKK